MNPLPIPQAWVLYGCAVIIAAMLAYRGWEIWLKRKQ